ncbi:MAG: hypothetical protein RSA44_05430, partial [Bacteroides sp.]
PRNLVLGKQSTSISVNGDPSVGLIDSRSVRTSHHIEYKTESAEAMLQITFCQIMLKKLIQ